MDRREWIEPPSEEYQRENPNWNTDDSEDSESDARPPEFTDDALALQFSERYRDKLRYVAAWGFWFEWTGRAWERDETVRVFDRARGICREASSACNHDRTAKQIASAKTVSAVERLARADRRHAAKVEQWDTDAWLLNTPAGTADLKTGHMRTHAPGDHITKTTAVAPAGECPQWHRFLARITGNNPDLQTFLQRVAGYSLPAASKSTLCSSPTGPAATARAST